jgi:hypothetical protein
MMPGYHGYTQDETEPACFEYVAPLKAAHIENCCGFAIQVAL